MLSVYLSAGSYVGLKDGVALPVPRLVHEFQPVPIEVGDVGGVVTGREVGPIGRRPVVDTPRFDGRGEGSINRIVAVADDPKIEARFPRLAPAKPDARANAPSGGVGVIAQPVQVGHVLRTRRRVIVSKPAPTERFQSFGIEGQRLLDVGNGDIDVIDHFGPTPTLGDDAGRRAPQRPVARRPRGSFGGMSVVTLQEGADQEIEEIVNGRLLK